MFTQAITQLRDDFYDAGDHQDAAMPQGGAAAGETQASHIITQVAYWTRVGHLVPALQSYWLIIRGGKRDRFPVAFRLPALAS